MKLKKGWYHDPVTNQTYLLRISINGFFFILETENDILMLTDHMRKRMTRYIYLGEL